MDASVVDEALASPQGPFGRINGKQLTAQAHALVEVFISGLSPAGLKALRNECSRRDMSPDQFRSFLRDQFRRQIELPQPVLKRMHDRLPESKLIAYFGEPFHRSLFPAWVRLFGKGRTELALVLDARPELDFILEKVRGLRPDQVPSLDTSIEAIKDALLICLMPISLMISIKFEGYTKGFTPEVDPDVVGNETTVAGKPVRSSSESTSETDANLSGFSQGLLKGQEARTRLEGDKRDLEALVKELRGEHERAMTDSDRRSRERLRQAAQDLDAERKSRSELATELAQVKARLSAVESDRDIEIQRGVDRELSAVVRPWLAEARSLEDLSADRIDKRLAERVHTILQAQAVFDTKYGSKTRLRHRLKQFEGYRSQIRNAQEDSIRPSPALGPIIAEVELEINRLRVALKQAEPDSPVIDKLENALHKADTAESLDTLADHIAALHAANVFTYKEHVRLTKQKLKAYDRLRTRNELTPAAPQRRSGRELCQLLGTNRKATVYLDGNNVVHRDDRYAHSFDETGRVSEEVEDALLRDVRTLASKCSAITFRIVFDSHTPSEQAITDNVIVQRSGGSGKDRADSAIVLHLAAKSDGNKCFVITDDLDLRGQTARLGGVYADVAVWNLLVEAFGAETVPVAKAVAETATGS